MIQPHIPFISIKKSTIEQNFDSNQNEDTESITFE